MRIVILAIGSRGDVQPYVALGLGLRRAGHRVRLATHAVFRDFVVGRGLEFFPLEGNPREAIDSEAGQAWLRSGRNPIAFFRHLYRLAEPLIERSLADSWAACQGADAIVYSALGWPGYHIAEELGVPCFPALLQPSSPTRAFPNMLVSTRPRLGGTFNYLSHVAFDQVIWQPFRAYTNRWRRKVLGLPPIPFWGPYGRFREQRLPYLYGYSARVVPKPADWPAWLHVTGYWFLDRPADWRPPERLVAFLRNGPPPVYVGFGSMSSHNATELTGLALRALALTGRRGVLLSGWAGLGGATLPDSVCLVDDVPHDWLFPRMAAVVHHGGAGTTAAGLRSGVPSIVCPFFADQPFWGRRVAELGVGSAPIMQQRLTAERLAAAIGRAVGDGRMRARANALGAHIRAEDGVDRAVEVIEAVFRT